MSKSVDNSPFNPRHPIGKSLESYCASVFKNQPDCSDAIKGFRCGFGNDVIKSRSTTRVESREHLAVDELLMPCGVSCPRFEMPFTESVFQQYLKPVEGVPFSITPQALAEDDAKFERPLLQYDVVGATDMEWYRKQKSFEVLNGIIASKQHLNDGNGPNILHYCHVSYLPQLLLRFVRPGLKVNHVTFLDQEGVGYTHGNLDEDLPKVDFSYSFMRGNIQDFAHYTEKQYVYRDVMERAVADGIFARDCAPGDWDWRIKRDILNMMPDVVSVVNQQFDDTVMAPSPMSYDIFFSGHVYEVVSDKKSIDALMQVMSEDGVGIMFYINENVLVDPVFAASHGYVILGHKSKCFKVCDTYTSRVYSEYKRDIAFAASAYLYAGAVIFEAASGSYPGVELELTSDDVTYTVYGFHRVVQELYPLPSLPGLDGKFTYDEVSKHHMDPLTNNPTQASYHDVYLGSVVYAPKLDGVTGILVAKSNMNKIYILVGKDKYVMNTDRVPCGVNRQDVAFQIEVLFHDKVSRHMNYIVVDLITQRHSQMPFIIKWNLVQSAMVNNKCCLQKYVRTWPSGGEGVVIQPLLHVNSDKVKLLGKVYVRSTAKYVKCDGDLDVVDFSVRCAYGEMDIDRVLPRHSERISPVCGSFVLWEPDEVRYIEVKLKIGAGRMEAVLISERDDRHYASVSKLPTNLIRYSDFKKIVVSDFANNIKLPAGDFTLRYGFERFMRILHLLIQRSCAGTTVDDDMLLLLLGAKEANDCNHSKFSESCIICNVQRSAFTHFPSNHFNDSIARFRGNILKELHKKN